MCQESVQCSSPRYRVSPETRKERERENVRIVGGGFNVLVEMRGAPRAPKLAPSLLDERSRALSGQVNARCRIRGKL